MAFAEPTPVPRGLKILKIDGESPGERLISTVRKFSRLRSLLPVMVVEDDPDTRRMLESMLAKDGWKVRTAENGRIALEQVASSMPGLVLLDLMMPEMDGFTLLEEFPGPAEGPQCAGDYPDREGSHAGGPFALGARARRRQRLQHRVVSTRSARSGSDEHVADVHAARLRTRGDVALTESETACCR